MPEAGQLNLPFKLYRRGKVRDVFEVAQNQLLIVSTDRISAFDFVLPSFIPDKGKILNQISTFWFKLTQDFIPNHIVCDRPEELTEFKKYSSQLEKRTVLTKKLKIFPLEAIVRGYVVGSGWKSYQSEGHICGIKLPSGLAFADKIPQPIFTPTTKAHEGHDENIDFQQLEKRVGEQYAKSLKDLSIELFNRVSRYAGDRGIIIADTKFEFGLDEEGKIVLADEIFTPDSSRFWKIEEYHEAKKKGIEPPAFDKQFVRNYLLNSTWDRQSIPPALPAEVIINTRQKYLEIYHILTGQNL